MTDLVGTFLEHGLLGVVSLIALWFAYKKDREAVALHESHAERVTLLNADHAAEMKALQERYISKAETWMGKYHEMADGQNEVLISLERRWGK
jgi:hypothetical protein